MIRRELRRQVSHFLLLSSLILLSLLLLLLMMIDSVVSDAADVPIFLVQPGRRSTVASPMTPMTLTMFLLYYYYYYLCIGGRNLHET